MYSALPIEMGAYGQPRPAPRDRLCVRSCPVCRAITPTAMRPPTPASSTARAAAAPSARYTSTASPLRAGWQGDPRFVWTAISVDAVDQFQVQTSGYSAIYEGQGIQNYTVKQGGNKYHGSVYEFFRNTALDTWGFFGRRTQSGYGQAGEADREQQRVRHHPERPACPYRQVERQGLLLRQLQRLPLRAVQTRNSLRFPRGAAAGRLQRDGHQPIYDPSTQTACTANSTNGQCRYQYGYIYGGSGAGLAGNPVKNGGCRSMSSQLARFSTVAKNMQQFLPRLSNQNPQNNYLAPNHTGLSNWSTTDRIDYVIGAKDTLIAGCGHRPAGQLRPGRSNHRRSQRRTRSL